MLETDRIIWEADGVETAVALKMADQLAFVVDGKTDGAVFIDRATQAFAGLIGAMVHESPKDVFVVGLGTGMSAGWLGAIPEVQRVDVAELEPSIVEVARAAARANQHVLDNPRVHLHFGDARELLLASRRSYDLVMSEPSNPYRAGISALYTREYYDAILSRLRAGGVFVQWVQGYEVDTETVRTVVRTLGSAFRNVEAWQTQYGDIVFVCGQEPRTLDVSRLQARVEREPYRSALIRTLLVSDVEGFLARFLANDSVLRQIGEADGVPVNTDDQNTLDYAFARASGKADESIAEALLSRALRANADRPAVSGAVDWGRFKELRARAWIVGGTELPRLAQGSDAAARRIAAVALGCDGRGADASRNWEAQQAEPRDDLERYVAATAYADRGDERALSLADVLEGRGLVVEAHFVRARLAAQAQDDRKAFEAVLRAVDALRRDALPLCSSAQQVLTLVTGLARKVPELTLPAVEALMVPFAVGLIDEARRDSVEKLAGSDPKLCVRALGSHVHRPRWEEAHLRARLGCLVAAKHPAAEAAAADLRDYLGATAGTFD